MHVSNACSFIKLIELKFILYFIVTRSLDKAWYVDLHCYTNEFMNTMQIIGKFPQKIWIISSRVITILILECIIIMVNPCIHAS